MLTDSSYGRALCAGRARGAGQQVTVQIAKRKSHTFKVMPKRWVVEIQLCLAGQESRAIEELQRWLNTSLQFVHLAFLALLLRRS